MKQEEKAYEKEKKNKKSNQTLCVASRGLHQNVQERKNYWDLARRGKKVPSIVFESRYKNLRQRREKKRPHKWN